MTETLSGHVERVTYHNPQNGFAVLKIKVPGRRDLATLLGNVSSVAAGEHVEATGRWRVDPRRGPQFQASQLKTTHPASPEGIQRYLASGAIRSIGPQLAARIVQQYQQRSLEILDEHAEMLLHIRGIGPGRLKRIRESWREQEAIRQIMLFFHECGIGSARAVRVHRTYGADAIEAIKANPYRLAEDIRGIGFRTADEIAAKIGVDPNSPHRAQAAIRYALQELARQGHCGFPEEGVTRRTTELVDIDHAVVLAETDRAVRGGAVIREDVEGESWLYLASLHRAEVALAESLQRLLADASHPLPAIDVEIAMDWVQQRLSLTLAPLQQEAIRQACRRKVLVITGGPGVGKTTLVRSILEIFAAKGRRCVLTAPTGRAAKRLAETTGRSAKTVHRLLEFDPARGEFARNRGYPLAGDLFVMDETSMVDVSLGHQFLAALPASCCLVLVGDVDQLPSVGPGTVLADIIASGAVPVVRLTEVFRQASRSRIVTAARAVNCGRTPDLAPPKELSDFYFIELPDPEAIQDTIIELVKTRIPARFGFDPKTDIQVLAPMNRSLLGARSLNLVLQNALNPSRGGPEVQRFGWTYRAGDRVIQTVNNYQRDVFNGDLGVIQKINRIEQEMTVSFEGRAVTYEFADLDELSLAYVLSVHKSQGSEYPCVVIPIHTQHYMMLQRNLLYTAVTRGRRLVVLVGARKALQMAIRRQDTRRRHTTLRRRLQGE